MLTLCISNISLNFHSISTIFKGNCLSLGVCFVVSSFWLVLFVADLFFITLLLSYASIYICYFWIRSVRMCVHLKWSICWCSQLAEEYSVVQCSCLFCRSRRKEDLNVLVRQLQYDQQNWTAVTCLSNMSFETVLLTVIGTVVNWRQPLAGYEAEQFAAVYLLSTCFASWRFLCSVLYWHWMQGSHASWKVLFFFLENSRTWKVLEKHWSWKVLKIEV